MTKNILHISQYIPFDACLLLACFDFKFFLTFIAMAYIKSQNMKDSLKSGFLELEEALEIAVQVAKGLQEAHDNGIIHRDIKPANKGGVECYI